MLDKIALTLAIIGGINWGSIGLFRFDIVAWIFGGQDSVVSRIIYTVVGLAALWCISLLFRDTSEDVISGIIADEISIGVVNTKTTAVRLIPAYGKKAGDRVDFGGLLGTAPVMPLNTYSPARFIRRGGRIPAPIHSLKN